MGKQNQKPGKKRPKSYYRKSGQNYTKQDRMLQSGMKGILITCSGNASQCVREAYNLLNEYADRIYGPEKAVGVDNQDAEDHEEEDSDEDISESLQKEVNALNEQRRSRERRFKNVLTGAKNLVFIQTNGVDPHRIVRSILMDLEETRTPKGRYIQRMLPVSHTCKAVEERIEKTAQEMLYLAFHSPEAGDSTFCIQFKARNNGQIHKDIIVKVLAPMVTQGSTHVHKVDFDDPDRTVMVDIIGAVCCLSVLEGYGRFKRYNLHLVARGDGGGDAGNGAKRKRVDASKDDGRGTEGAEAEADSDPTGGKRRRMEDSSDVATATNDSADCVAATTDTATFATGDATITKGDATTIGSATTTTGDATTLGTAATTADSVKVTSDSSDCVSTSRSAAATLDTVDRVVATSESASTVRDAADSVATSDDFTITSTTPDSVRGATTADVAATAKSEADCVAASETATKLENADAR